VPTLIAQRWFQPDPTPFPEATPPRALAGRPQGVATHQ
jgi:hypothetical protein